MPNRILKESICRSDSIDVLSWFEEVLFYRLIVNCDDYGRFDGRSAIIKGVCFPLKDITQKDIEKALNKLSAAGLVRVYEAQGRPVLQLVTWESHQIIRAKKSKYPACDETCMQMISSDSNSLRNPIQSESNSESESESIVCSEVNSEPPIITLQLNTGEEFGIKQSDIDTWCGLYPAVDVIQQLRNMKGWLLSNPSKRKTNRGIMKFVTSWLQREQDKGGNRQEFTSSPRQPSGNKFNNFPQREYSQANYSEMEQRLLQMREG